MRGRLAEIRQVSGQAMTGGVVSAFLAAPLCRTEIVFSSPTTNPIAHAANTTMQLPTSRACWKFPVIWRKKPVTVGASMPANAPAVFMMPARDTAANGGATSVHVVHRMEVEADSDPK